MNIDSAFELVGAFGWYQFVQSFINTVVNGATMFFFNAFAFLEVSPQLECEFTPGVITYTNSTNEAALLKTYCGPTVPNPCAINEESKLTLNNLILQLDFVCAPGW